MKENYFRELQGQILKSSDSVLFDEKKIKEMARNHVEKSIEKQAKTERGLFFEKIVLDFFDFLGFKVTRTKKTRDLGIDGIIKTELPPFGLLRMGLQVKYKEIDSSDIDAFIQALNFAEIRVGVVACRKAGRLDKYTISTKVKALLLGSENNMRIGKRIDLKPVFVMNLNEIIGIFSQHTRDVVKSVYKR